MALHLKNYLFGKMLVKRTFQGRILVYLAKMSFVYKNGKKALNDIYKALGITKFLWVTRFDTQETISGINSFRTLKRLQEGRVKLEFRSWAL